LTADMSDFVMVTGDTVTVTFATMTITSAPGPQPLVGSGAGLRVGGFVVCLEGDELPPSLKGPLSYTDGPFRNPGTGTLKLLPVKGVNTTRVLTDGGRAVLLKGAVFPAVFTVTSPATNPKGDPDSTAPKSGTASFSTGNSILTAH